MANAAEKPSQVSTEVVKTAPGPDAPTRAGAPATAQEGQLPGAAPHKGAAKGAAKAKTAGQPQVEPEADPETTGQISSESKAQGVTSTNSATSDSVLVQRPDANGISVVDIGPAKRVEFAFSLKDAKIIILDVDAVLVFPDNGKIILPGFAYELITPSPPKLKFSEGMVDPQRLIARVEETKLSDQLPSVTLTSASQQDAAKAKTTPQVSATAQNKNTSTSDSDNPPPPVGKVMPYQENQNLVEKKSLAEEDSRAKSKYVPPAESAPPASAPARHGAQRGRQAR